MKLILLCFSGAASVEKGYMNILSLPHGSSRQLCCSHGTSRSPLFWNSTGSTFLFSCSSQKLNFSWTAPDCADFPIEYGRFCPNRLTVSQLSIAIHSYPWGFPSPSRLSFAVVAAWGPRFEFHVRGGLVLLSCNSSESKNSCRSQYQLMENPPQQWWNRSHQQSYMQECPSFLVSITLRRWGILASTENCMDHGQVMY
jgi:hypothetical protein